MRKIFPFLLLLVFSALACNSIMPVTLTAAPTQFSPTKISPTQASLPQTEADVPRISVEEAKAALDSGEAIILDVRSVEAYAESRIAGAVNIPLVDIEIDPAGLELEKNRWIITYCT